MITPSSKVIFLDIDGPMIPVRASFLPNQTLITSVFDPCAVSLVNKLITISGASVVISSVRGDEGRSAMVQLLESNGISSTALHTDWVTPRKMSSYRCNEVRWWLDRHPEITHSVAIDDEDLNMKIVPCAVKCDEYEGFSWRNYLECCVHLDSYEHPTHNSKSNYEAMIYYAKRKEIWRTTRANEPIQHRVWHLSDQLFPPIPVNPSDNQLSEG